MNTSVPTIDETVQKTNILLKTIEDQLGWENRKDDAYSVLRAVLHALRDRLTVAEAIELASGLPLLVKGVYFDTWKPAKNPVKMDVNEFLLEIASNTPDSVENSSQELAQAVWFALSKYVSTGEQVDVLSIIPKKIASVLEEGIE